MAASVHARFCRQTICVLPSPSPALAFLSEARIPQCLEWLANVPLNPEIQGLGPPAGYEIAWLDPIRG